MRSRIGIIFGGRSGEHEISIRSAVTVIQQIDKSKYSIIPIAIDKTGRWLDPKTSAALLPKEAADAIAEDVGEIASDAIAFIGDPKYRGLSDMSPDAGQDRVHRIDVAFPVLHGTFGEDGTIQGVFEMADIPYVGCGVVASACGMDKTVMKALFANAGLPICRHKDLLRSSWEKDPDAVVEMLESGLGYPMFVKPANLGSSVGISRAADRAELRTAIDEAAQFDTKIIAEEELKMREIECAVLGNDEPVASLPGEYMIKNKDKAFLDYTEKYAGTGNNEFIVPAPLSAELTKKIQDLAISAFKAVNGSGLARVDFFLRTDTGALLVNEINTMPGLTDASGFPKMWKGTGKEFRDVIDELIALALERHADRSRNKTSRPT